MKVRAALLRTQGALRPYAGSRPIEVTTVDLDPPGPGEVLVEVRAAGVCHSDLTTVEVSKERPLPAVMGHEGAGTVIGLGDGVDDLAIGDHVVFVFTASCGACRACLAGRPTLCSTYAATKAAGELATGGRRLHEHGDSVAHYVGVSCFAEKAVVSRRSVVPIDSDIAFEDAALFGCAVMTGVGAALNTGGVRAGDRVAVVGLGGVGLSCLMGCAAAGAAQIIAVDVSLGKLALARELGATQTFDARDPDLAEAIRAVSDGGVDIGFEMAGRVDTLALALAATTRGGLVVTAGLAAGGVLPLSTYDLVTSGKRIAGSYMGDAVVARDLPRLVELFRQGRLPVDRLRSHTLPLEDVNEAFDRLADGAAVRQMISF